MGNNSGKYTLPLSLISILLISYVVNKCTPSDREYFCREERRFSGMTFEGVVDSAFVDKYNHGYRVVNYVSVPDSSENRLNITFDKSGLFTYLEAGDTIIKQKGSMHVNVNDDTVFVIDYGVECE